jgi:hypothetical protein
MEKPSAAPILLGAGALAVVVAVGVLVVKVRASAPAPDLAPQEIASAQARTAASAREGGAASRPGGMIGAPAGLPRPPARMGSSDEGEAPDPPSIISPEATLERVGKAGVTSSASDGDDGEPAAGSLAAKQTEANQLYDRGDYEAAAQLAEEILKDDPKNARVLRIAASSACVMGEGEKAKGYHARLEPRDQRKIARRCQRYGIEF